jgi:hypothetical protein
MKTKIRSRAARAIMQAMFDYTWNHYVLQRHTRRSTGSEDSSIISPVLRFGSTLWDATVGFPGNTTEAVTPPLPTLRRTLVDLAEREGLTVPGFERAADRKRRQLRSNDPVTRSLAAVEPA